MRALWTTFQTGCILMGITGLRGAPNGAGKPRSSLSGVFTAEQAEQGQDLYATRCRSCHTQAGHAKTFKDRWAGRPLSEPFEFIGENMPKDSPGTLSPEETAVVLAYMLQ